MIANWLAGNISNGFKPYQEVTMYSVPDQFNSTNKAGIETLARLASTTFAGMERLAALNLNAVRTLMEQGTNTSRALLAADDAQGVLSLPGKLAQTDVKKAADYTRRVYEIANQTRESLSKVVESQVSELKTNLGMQLDQAVKSAPAGSDLALNALRSALAAANSAYESMNKTARQAGELTEANLAVAAKFAFMQGKKAA